MATMNVSLPDPMKAWVEDQLNDGQYSNASDYVRHLIRKDQDRKKAIAALQVEITKGIESGLAEPFDPEAFNREMLERHGRR